MVLIDTTGKYRVGVRTLVSLIPKLTFFPLCQDECSIIIVF